MALDKERLAVQFKGIFDGVSPDADIDLNPEGLRQKLANEMAEAIDAFVKSATVTVAFGISVSTTGSATAQTGETTNTGQRNNKLEIMKGVLVDTNYDLAINVRRNNEGLIIAGFVVGDNTDQCAVFVLGMSQGELKEDPLLGAGLTKFIRGNYSKSQVELKIRQHLTRAGINYNEYKELITTTIKTTEA